MFVPIITAADIHALMCGNDLRGCVVDLREFCKQWAQTGRVG
ncbi:MAG: hypothetical protein OXD37_09370 [Acidimicrobiaceae bacterium]|nr:hypothetical protein [Acidimicrobiaceae bacterium]